MQIRVQARDGYMVVAAAGVLDLAGAGRLRDALLKAAAEQPEAIVADLNDLTATAPALTVLLAVADQVARWPSCPLVVLAPRQPLRALLEGVGMHRRMPLVPSLEDVPGALGRRPEPRAVLHLAPTLAAPAEARAFLATCLTTWAPRGVDGPDGVGSMNAMLVLDELVTNAVLHAGTELEVLLSARHRTVRVAVGDRSERVAARRDAGGDDENGRGLALVGALSRHWGVLPRRGMGKVVWAVLRADPPASSGRPGAVDLAGCA